VGPPEAPPASRPRADTRFGTCVAFVSSPEAAFRKAGKDDKLVFVLHISGNFEDSGFT